MSLNTVGAFSCAVRKASNTSFSEMGDNAIYTALNTLDTNIASYANGVHMINNCTVVLTKYAANYYSGIATSFSFDGVCFFRRNANGRRTILLY